MTLQSCLMQQATPSIALAWHWPMHRKEPRDEVARANKKSRSAEPTVRRAAAAMGPRFSALHLLRRGGTTRHRAWRLCSPALHPEGSASRDKGVAGLDTAPAAR